MHPVYVLFSAVVLLETTANGLLTPIQHNVDELYAIIQQLNTSVKHLEIRSAQQSVSMKHLEVTDAQQNAFIAQQNASMKHLKFTVAQQNAFIAQQNASVKHLEFTVAQQNAYIARQNATVDNLALTVAQQNASINNLIHQQANAHSVGFFAKLTQSIDHLGDGQAIEFDQVVTNVGNAYDPRHGRFTVPVDGMYLISASVMSNPTKHLNCELIRNGAVVMGLFAATSESQADTLAVVLELLEGDMLWIRHMSARPDEYFFSFSSYFSGFLIKQH